MQVKPGDYIQLTSVRFSFNKVGDIMPVDYVGESGVYVATEDHPHKVDNIALSPGDQNYLDDWFYDWDEVEVLSPREVEALGFAETVEVFGDLLFE